MRRLEWIDRILYLAAGAVVVELLIILAWPAIEAWWHRPKPGRQVAQQFLGSIDGTGSERNIRVDYLLYLPENYDEGKQWPLVVYLHGSGSRGNDLEKVRHAGLPIFAEQKHDLPFVLVSPQCPEHASWEPESVLALIKYICNDWPTDRQRVYLVGYSMGGFGTWRTAAAAPERFAAIVPIAGGGNPKEAEKLVGLPVWAFHGETDQCVPLKASQAMVDAVRAAGGNPKLTILENTGHGISGAVCSNKKMWNWLLSQRRSAAK